MRGRLRRFGRSLSTACRAWRGATASPASAPARIQRVSTSTAHTAAMCAGPASAVRSSASGSRVATAPPRGSARSSAAKADSARELRLIADELREQPFLAARRRQPGVLGALVRRTALVDIAPEHGVANAAAEVLVDAQKMRLAARERVVEVHEKREGPLAALANFGAEG